MVTWYLHPSKWRISKIASSFRRPGLLSTRFWNGVQDAQEGLKLAAWDHTSSPHFLSNNYTNMLIKTNFYSCEPTSALFYVPFRPLEAESVWQNLLDVIRWTAPAGRNPLHSTCWTESARQILLGRYSVSFYQTPCQADSLWPSNSHISPQSTDK